MKCSILKKWMVTLVIILLYFNIGIQGMKGKEIPHDKEEFNAFIEQANKKFEVYTDKVVNFRDDLKDQLEGLNQQIKSRLHYDEDIPMKKTQSCNSYLGLQKDSNELSRQVDALKKLYKKFSAKEIVYQDEVDTTKSYKELKIKLNKEKEDAIEKLQNEKNNLIKDSKTELSDSKILHEKTITELTNKNEEKITEVNNNKEIEMMNLKEMHHKEMKDGLHEVHHQYITGIIIGSIVVIVGLIVFFCTYCGCFKHTRKAKNEIENSDIAIEGFGELLNVSQIQIASGACPRAVSTQGESSLSYCIVLGNIPLEMSEEHEISGRQITRLTAQEEEYSTEMHLDLKESQFSGIKQISDYDALQEEDCDSIICNAKTDLTTGSVFWKKSTLNKKCYGKVESQEGV